MVDGLLVVEFESLPVAGSWALESEIGGFTGEGYLRWDGPDLFDTPGQDPFAIDFLVAEDGLYDLRLRNHHDDPDSTQANDVWIRMDGGAWIKLFSPVKDQWTWASNLEWGPEEKPPAQFDLLKGAHRLEFSGRSFDFRLDRLHLFTPGHPDGTNPSAPPSPTVPINARPVAKILLDPPALPEQDHGTTIVTLDGTGSFDPEGGHLKYTWQVDGADFVEGTDSHSPVARIRLRRSGFAQPIRLTIADPKGATRSATVTLDVAGAPSQVRGEPVVWHPFEVLFHGPKTDESASAPNPFLDYRLNVTWTAPDGREILVPGFFDGDGEGGGSGDIWVCRFAADQKGIWSYRASFRLGESVAVSLDGEAGVPTDFDGTFGRVRVMARQKNADGFLSQGRLEYVGEHYLKFRDGGFFLKGGSNSPENLLGFAGFDDVEDSGGVGIIHHYEPHVADWKPGDPLFTSSSTGVDSRGLIGALNYLASQGVNSVYFLPMNLGGDGQETSPFISSDPTPQARRHYDISRLHQWGLVFDHAQRLGILLHVVLAETEWDNETWLDEGQLGPERKLFFRELCARFGHVPALKWNLSEENDYSIALLNEFAGYLRAVDAYDHPIAVHTHPDDFSDYGELVGNPLFDLTSIQYTSSLAAGEVEEWRQRSEAAGRPWVLDMDENGTWDEGLNDSNADLLRRQVLWDVYFSGGELEWYAGYHELPLGGDLRLEDFRTRQPMWRSMRIAREFMLAHLPFWEMQPADELVLDESQNFGGGECFAKPGEVYAIYLPSGNNLAKIDLSGEGPQSQFTRRWFNPRSGRFEGKRKLLSGGSIASLGSPPGQVPQDWVILIERID